MRKQNACEAGISASIRIIMTTHDPTISYSLTVFSPSGKLVQIEHALAAVAGGTTSLGIKASNGIVIAAEKKTSSILIDDSVIDRVAVICPNIGIVYSGMGPDFRVLVTKARKSAQAYWKIYGTYPRHESLHRKLPLSCNKRPNPVE
ncbi:hypothetical protein D9611_014517 [Ephemerocybe angulata]|uniref:Proteasome alpha-type subunits domain-containing protein n=1 Tax=Ephemerocybe angulata TaxID=980116 RepID=A0A8H5CAJ4_9AGAR|nr:hypothetical protein D9611_014517 [Tulosesus angulatus]